MKDRAERPGAPVVGVAGIAFDHAGRVLLIQRGRAPGAGLWTVPGGRVELGETLAEACAREFREETGLHVEIGAVAEVVDRIDRGDHEVRHHFVIIDFLVTVRGGALAAGDDASDARWCTDEELDELPLTEGLAPIVRRARTRATRQG